MSSPARYGILALALCAACSLGFASPSRQDQSQSRTAPSPEDRVDINTATLDQLMKVPGMTRTWAARIIRFRPYRTKNDLLDHGVVSNQVYSRIKDHIIAHRANQ